jgi:hypothetical protein
LNKHFRETIFFFLGLLLISGTRCWAADQPAVAWMKQYGNKYDDIARKIAVDTTGNVYITGSNVGDLDGNIGKGNEDIFLSKFGGNGKKYWTRTTGTADYDTGYGLALDAAGNIYVTGGIASDSSHTTNDIFFMKYDANGNKLWLNRAGTTDNDIGYAVAADNTGHFYVTGVTTGSLDGNANAGGADIFLIKYDSDGNKLWTRQTGTTEDDMAYGVTTDAAGNSYLTGYTIGSLNGNTNLGSSDIFIMKYDADGNKLWTKQTGTDQIDVANYIAIDGAGNLYLTGETQGSLDGNANQGDYDICLLKYDTDGNKLWTRQLGNDQVNVGYGVTTDTAGNVYVTGYTQGALEGNSNIGNGDIFLTKYDGSGNKLWTKQAGSAATESAYGAASDGAGSVYLTGYTYGNLDDNVNAGGADIVLMKYNTSSAVVLSWPNETGYSNGGLFPTGGDDTTVFNFRILYTNANNYAPQTGYPKLHIQNNSVEISGSPFAMTATDTTDVDYTNGKEYAYQTTLPLSSSYAYWFESIDDHGVISGGVPTGILLGPNVAAMGLTAVYTFPNPVTGGRLNFHLFSSYAEPEFKIQVFNVAGEKVATLGDDKFDRTLRPVYYLRDWHCQNDAGEALAGGVYVYILEVRDTNSNDTNKFTGKFAIIK